MFGKKRHQFIGNFFKSQLLVFLLLSGLLIVLVWPLVINLNKRSQLDREIEQLKTEVAKAESKNNDFKKMIEYLESNQFAEEQARLNLNLKKAGEKVAVIKDDSTSVSAEPATVEQTESLGTEAPYSYKIRVRQWLDYFFGQGI